VHPATAPSLRQALRLAFAGAEAGGAASARRTAAA
jgi:hypothetical protein